MFKSQSVTKAEAPMPRSPCPRCGTDMTLAFVVPAKLGYEVRTLECSNCGYDKMIMVESDLKH